MAKTKKELKGEVILIRVTTIHKAAFTKAAKEDGMELSTWVRHVAILEARERGHLRD